jgi:hypothetical protein
MTAEVAILVDKKDAALQVPPQAVIERQGAFYCLLDRGEKGIEAQQVEIGASNEEAVVVEEGLSLNDQVVLSPEQFEEDVVFPTLSSETDQLAQGDTNPVQTSAAQSQSGGSSVGE